VTSYGLGLRDYHTEIVAASRTGSGKVYSHVFSPTLRIKPSQLGCVSQKLLKL
jgi:hypothetical protein